MALIFERLLEFPSPGRFPLSDISVLVVPQLSGLFVFCKAFLADKYYILGSFSKKKR